MISHLALASKSVMQRFHRDPLLFQQAPIIAPPLENSCDDRGLIWQDAINKCCAKGSVILRAMLAVILEVHDVEIKFNKLVIDKARSSFPGHGTIYKL